MSAFAANSLLEDDPSDISWLRNGLPARPSLTADQKATPQAEIHILVVDDEPHFCGFLRLSLQEAGYVVHTAADGQAALDVFQAAPIDLVLTDIQMPLMDGYALCAQLRIGSAVPIIMLSAAGEPADLLLGFRAGADAYIAKPLQLHEVEERIQRLLRRPPEDPQR